jgi:hypothetical protein
MFSFPPQTDEIGIYRKEYNVYALPEIYTTVADQNNCQWSFVYVMEVFVLIKIKLAVFPIVYFYFKNFTLRYNIFKYVSLWLLI